MRYELNSIKSGIERARVAAKHPEKYSTADADAVLGRIEEYVDDAIREHDYLVKTKETAGEVAKLRSEAEIYRNSKNSREFYLGWTIFVIIVQTLLIVALVYNARRP